MTKVFALFVIRCFRTVSGALLVSAFVLLSFASSLGQSSEQELPTPVRAADISATIAVRDLGDPRLTRHFYIFTGTPGDLAISVDSKNLNGDVDVFTAAGFRPLVKISLFAGDTVSRTSKSIYLRERQDLILRVEGRSPNDEPGSYRIQFGGSFEPFSGEIAGVENATSPEETPADSSSGKKGRRVSAVGARINEPAPVVEEKAAEQPAEVAAPSTEPEAPKPARTSRNRAPNRRNPRPSRPKPSSQAKAKPTETTAPEGGEKPAETAKPDEPGQPTQLPSAGETQIETGPRLIIETKDGTRIERPMSTVRRVVVDNGQIIVMLKSGKVERTPLTSITKMSIEP
ncbi:MAG: hypothetical protein QOD75_1444 [Blastocatellia bacterium]|jgi:hypothetical protein|nr:hypothetical protein [Blastocatellia bacterium]